MNRPGKILIVEDAYLVACDIAQTLSNNGYDVDVIASDEEAALAYLSETRPSFALLDLNLGHGQTSLSVARRLRELQCPYIFVTGHTRDTFALPAEHSGARWVSKPFSERQLICALKDVA